MTTDYACEKQQTCLNRTMYVGAALVEDPVEAGLDGEAGQHAVLAAVAVAGRQVHGPALVVQRVVHVRVLLVPALDHPQPHPRPLVHHADRQRVQLLFATLEPTTLYVTYWLISTTRNYNLQCFAMRNGCAYYKVFHP